VLGEVVAETKARGASVVFTDHRSAVVHAHADEVFRVEQGKLARVDSGDPDVRIVLHGPGAGDWQTEPGVVLAVLDGPRVELTVPAERSDAVLLLALRRGWSVREVAGR
jgi:ABC-2 type transport system ATP-binding protein